MKSNPEVQNIIDFLTEKITRQKAKLSEYESPIMQEMIKSSPHLQYEYIRTKTELESHEDILLAINKFTKPENKNGNRSKDKQG